ncbi:unnamed protein product [Enterobius vermicularis]|uniref:Sugar phosphate phosphatase n=1 Tax=Enterobius vermicularis TaxID=51028 RepID=A0A0N4UYD7_ENTVE|nr:unnamed protein product [Enterobius vermicularis]
MKYEMQTDKPLRDLNDQGENHDMWNTELDSMRKKEVTWYKAAWLFVECYLYRRIAGSFVKTSTLTRFDPFTTQKQNITLWGNKCDLSLSGGTSVGRLGSPLELVDQLVAKILVNDIDEAVKLINAADPRRIDIALDNAGLELFEDLLFGDFLIQSKKVDKVIFHGKSIPWFVSDVTNNDFFWLTEMLLQSHCEEVKSLCLRWKEHLEAGAFKFQAHSFWTTPFDYSLMSKYAPELYEDLSLSSLIVFKGDLHYRKLTGDRSWPLDFSFTEALRGFHPAPLLALRTLKAETQVGLRREVIERMQKDYNGKKEWMVTGEYAVAQLSK